ncbi:MAG: hypothetical protein IJA32_05915 [Lachnospiraceae bacterium]|nr:hypothetical protein [Lachnospiraceae bacterium]
MWNKKKVVDERILKESNVLLAKMFYVSTLFTVILLVVKIVCRLPLFVYGLEIIALLASFVYLLVCEGRKGILFVKKDEELKSIHEEILSKAMMINFSTIIDGELLFWFLAKEYRMWAVAYLVIWMVPAMIITVASIKNGWLIWGSKKRETEGKKNFKSRVIVGSFMVGLVMGLPNLYHDGAFHAEGILWILGMGISWGVLFYWFFLGLMKMAENKADKNLKEKEPQNEE